MRVFILTIALLGAVAWTVQARAEQQLVVFFHEGERDLIDPKQWAVGPEGETIIADAAAAYKIGGGFILLIGGDQNVGSARDAFVRSRLRAEAVRDILVRRGVPATSVGTKPCGFSAPIVERPKGVSEAQNRYVVFNVFDRKSDAIKTIGMICPSAGRDAAS